MEMNVMFVLGALALAPLAARATDPPNEPTTPQSSLKHKQAMDKGASQGDASVAAEDPEPAGTPVADKARAKKAKQAMDKGETAEDAAVAAEDPAPAGDPAADDARARRHKEAMDKGEGHQAASDDAEKP
jgi:hypothetical protein